MKPSILFLFIALWGSFGLQAQSDSLSDDQYQKQLKEQFRSESFVHRSFNRYDVNDGFAKYAVGLSTSVPLTGWKNVHNTWGVRYRRNHFDVGVSFWSGSMAETSDTAKFNRLSAGYITPLTALGFGNRPLGIMGLRIQGIAAVGLTRTNKKYGLYAAPGIHLELPFCSVGARANLEYTFGGGINVFPEVSLQLDGLWDLFDPSLTRTGTYHSSSTRVEHLGMGWYKVTHTEYNSPFVIKDVGPFWGITPRFGRAFSAWATQPYNSYGLGISGRISYFGADIRIDRGNVVSGVVSNANALDPMVKSEFDNEKVQGIVPTTELTIEGNFNIVGLFLSIFKKNAISKMGNTTTPLNRLNFNLGITRFVPGQPKYLNSDSAQAYTDQFFNDRPKIERNAINDPLKHEKEWGVTYGLSYEMGAVGVRVNNRLSKTIGKGTTLDVYYILPVTKLVRRLKTPKN